MWLALSWLDSSVGRALHRYHGGHGFESRSGLNFFATSFYAGTYVCMSSYIELTISFPSTEEEALRETKRVTEALTVNNYPANFIYSGRQLNRQQAVNDTDQRGISGQRKISHFNEF